MQRLDQALVSRQLVTSRTVAAKHIQAGEVIVNGQKVTKPATKVVDRDVIRLTVSGPQYASRAGHKLAGALDVFHTIDVSGARCLDAGASTGGFTDVLLQRGAREVVAVDVGHDQLIQRLRVDPRVEAHEGLNVRYLGLTDIGQPVDLVVSDLSFISLTLVVGALVSVCVPGSHVVLMIKPQFEIGRERLPKTGVVTDPHQRREAVLDVIVAALAQGLVPQGVATSPLPGQDGNKEFFFWATYDVAGAHLHATIEVSQWLDAQRVQWAD
ncbi:TlyA family RNA methyltransferase [Enteractinococcus coprophilus]|uniref:23S rRNA (Cytidine1920-2'-O)/16S rRNA (Cytidine1409-2'-O)-methyltransferase n=1 Tax=Enteractinococcus coprophilus TaxID=1027633 RepID=A0A543AJX6_9MICC|nr:TlyA family RNA methyltransferase [Enteractinococcus coprophilus]TQL72879.1 23S rRNA (cytidine1920-2'-O)/16S rRNA (cytidine1409-2'-O)-methyltransferase [Enteractinococcus coprophilus]